MTPEKAIKFFDEEIVRLEGAPIINGCEMTGDWRGHLEICKLAKSALEKQIPKKPEKRQPVNNGTVVYGYCPICGDAVKNFKAFCGICGQALDWSDTE